jgi:hypothetical protein
MSSFNSPPLGLPSAWWTDQASFYDLAGHFAQQRWAGTPRHKRRCICHPALPAGRPLLDLPIHRVGDSGGPGCDPHRVRDLLGHAPGQLSIRSVARSTNGEHWPAIWSSPRGSLERSTKRARQTTRDCAGLLSDDRLSSAADVAQGTEIARPTGLTSSHVLCCSSIRMVYTSISRTTWAAPTAPCTVRGTLASR